MPGKITSSKNVKEELAAKNFAPRKSLGQNFLIDENILQKITAAGCLDKQDVVLEIGPGLGALTEKLLESVNHVIAVEYDRGLCSILAERLAGNQGFTLINRDILETNLPQFFGAFPGNLFHYKVIANLPYYITTPVIFELIESGLPWERMVFLVQKEVADRLNAKPGGKDYGALTVMLGYYGKVEKIGVVPRTVFYPKPQVDSAIIRIMPSPDRWDPEIYPYLRRVVQAAFGQRRKTILNALASMSDFEENKLNLISCLRELRIDPQRRGETLTLPEFLNLALEIHSRQSRGYNNGIR